MEIFFLVLLVLLVVLAVLFAVGAAYITRSEERERKEFADQARRRASSERQRDGREFYKSLGLGTGEQVKIRLFTLEEYRDELGGDPGSQGEAGFMGALKAYQRFGGEWYETPPEKAAAPLDLGEDEYRLDEERHVILLKKLPPGIPPSARDLFEP